MNYTSRGQCPVLVPVGLAREYVGSMPLRSLMQYLNPKTLNPKASSMLFFALQDLCKSLGCQLLGVEDGVLSRMVSALASQAGPPTKMHCRACLATY